MTEKPAADPAVYFADPDEAYEALLLWKRDRQRVKDRRIPLVLGALRVFPKGKRQAVAHRGSGLARMTIKSIAAQLDGPAVAVTEFQLPFLGLYAEVLQVQADRLTTPPSTEAESPEGYKQRFRERRTLQALSQRLHEAVLNSDADYQALAAELRREADDARSGVTDTYDGPLRRPPEDQHLDQMVADHLDAVAAQITQFRLRGDDANDELDPEQVAEARRRLRAESHETRVQLAGNERYAQAVSEGRTIHGRDEDEAASAVLRAACRMAELQQEMATLRKTLLRPVDEEALSEEDPQASAEEATAHPVVDGDPTEARYRALLRSVASKDDDVHEALIAVLGEDQVADFLADAEETA